MILIFAIALGGAIGSVGRFFIGRFFQNLSAQNFPFGILAVNIIGCFFMGILTALLLEKLNVPHALRSMLLVGILGGFTTFSGFTIDVINMFEKGIYLGAFSYIAATVVLCLTATGLGLVSIRYFIR